MDTTRELYSRLLLAMGCTVALGCSSNDRADLSDGGSSGSDAHSTGGAVNSAGGAVHSAGGAALSAGGVATGGSVGAGGSAGSRGTGGARAAGGAQTGGIPVDAGPDATGEGAGGTAGGGAGGTSGEGTGGHSCSPWPQCATVRRPFLVGASMRSSSVADRGDWSMHLPPCDIADPRTAEFLAAAWLKDALEEHASVAAFARFTMLLLSVGAPPDLVVASQRASVDEVAHARACFALARRYGARAVGPAALRVADSIGTFSLEEITALTVAEGCVGETLGAIVANAQLRDASDPEVRRILRRIARDEARHAELAWRFLAWALRAGGDRVAAAAEEAFRETVDEVLRMPVVDYGVDLAAWKAHGRVTCAEARNLSRDGAERVVWPCWRVLLAERRGPRRDSSSVVA